MNRQHALWQLILAYMLTLSGVALLFTGGKTERVFRGCS